MGRRASGLGQTLAIKFQAVGEKGKRRRIKSNEASKRTRDENILATAALESLCSQERELKYTPSDVFLNSEAGPFSLCWWRVMPGYPGARMHALSVSDGRVGRSVALFVAGGHPSYW